MSQTELIFEFISQKQNLIQLKQIIINNIQIEIFLEKIKIYSLNFIEETNSL